MRQPNDSSTIHAHSRSSVAAIGARTLVGVALLTRPLTLLHAAAADESAGEKVAIYARILGARHLAEAAILWRWTTPTVVRAGAAVDTIHAVSSLALVTTHHRPRLAALNVASASTFALLGFTLARRIGRRGRRHHRIGALATGGGSLNPAGVVRPMTALV